ncbi:MAG: hypothetical protein RMJ33_13025 [Saprospiraceae bacterium]|nr:hypothetical protein [Saprospiraceae bacterium]MDW8230751.1 hypothetical protein [Saprospiraceae bacterium]
MTPEGRYIEVFLEPIRKCRYYRPKFGYSQHSEGVTLEEFAQIYGADPFYSWIGLNSRLLYAAHKAAGGMTSVYRQIGVGCERLFREIIMDTAGYADPSFAQWSYEVKTGEGRVRVHSLDARLEFSAIKNASLQSRLYLWLSEYCRELGVQQPPVNGVVFEVRQGYKSKDSKRQNADIDNATVAWANSYLPVFAIFSAQIDADVVLRYRNSRCGILVGSNSIDPGVSLFAFCKEVLGYDLAQFFQENTEYFRAEIDDTLKALLDAN